MQQKVLDQIEAVLKDEPSVHAMWLEGSWSRKSNDEFSDIDLWLDVDDGSEKNAFRLVKKTIGEFGELDLELDMHQEHPRLEHRIYHLKDTSPYHIYEVVTQAHSRKFVFTRSIHEITVLFDKDNTIHWQDYDEAKVHQELKSRAQYLREFLSLGQMIIDKQIKRGKYIDSFGYYVRWCLQPFIELVRIKYCPGRADLWIKDLKSDLPPEVVKEVEPLFQVSSLEDISKNVEKASRLVKSLD